ncbi:MAG: sodium/proline symporter, partial [Chlamydiae bacterium]|nr:sodium/proline symporter [Chlamydiota bacterium]
MLLSKLIAVVIYIGVLLGVALFSYKKNQTSSDYIIGGRGLNFWLTALAAHASDMSSWLLMAYPAVIYTQGMFQAWIGIGLVIFMYVNWKFIAPKIRQATEKYNSMTLSSFFESRYNDTSGLIRVITALMLFLFYTIYISAGLIGLGLLLETLFNCNYHLGITLGICVVIPYLFIGGYVTLAWTDLFQGIFLMLVCIFVPFYVLHYVLHGTSAIVSAAKLHNVSLSLLPNFKISTLTE